MKTRIRYARANDYLGVDALCREVHEEHVRALPGVFVPVRHVYHPIYYAELISAETSSIFVAEDEEERIVGYAVIEMREVSDIALLVGRRYAYIANFGVSSQCRGQGIGQRLFRACSDWARDQKAASIELNVWEFNQSAIGFYQKLGLHTLSRKMEIELPRD